MCGPSGEGALIVTMLSLDPATLARRTPPGRDRYLDLLRALAIAVVVVGHWLLAVVWVEGGELQAEPLLSAAPASRWLTWVVQVMPVFFLVGGAVNVRSWRAARSRGDGYGAWLRTRAARLLAPVVALLWAWVVAGPLLVAAGLDRAVVQFGGRNALLPLWFLAVYLGVVACVPGLLALHERWGLRVPAGLALAAGVVDVAHHTLGVPLVGWANFLLVWSAPTVLGFCWADGLLERRAVRVLLPVAGAVALVVLVAGLGYPVSMVGVDGAARSNNSPPSLALVALGWVQAGAVLAARAPVTRWLQRPRVWAGVVALNLVAMTVYLWHQTVMVVAVAGLHAFGVGLSLPPLTVAWWATRPLWVTLLAVGLLPLVALLSPVERRTPGTARVTGAAGVGLAVAAAAGALATLIFVGVAPAGTAAALPAGLATVVTAGAVAVGAVARRPAVPAVPGLVADTTPAAPSDRTAPAATDAAGAPSDRTAPAASAAQDASDADACASPHTDLTTRVAPSAQRAG